MKVILTKDVAGLGKTGDVKDVSEGHARNLLLRRNLALPATSELLAKAQKEQQEKQIKIAKDQDRAIALKHKLEGKTIKLAAKANGKNLFASIQPQQIAEKLAEIGIEITAASIKTTKPIKSIGQHEVSVRLAKNVQALLKLDVERES